MWVYKSGILYIVLASCSCQSLESMSFRDTFTKSDTSSQNLQYDDIAAYHFYTTVLIILLIPLCYSVVRTILNPFGHIPKLSDIEKKPQFSKKIVKFKKENRYSYITCGFMLKVVLIGLMAFGLFYCYNTLEETGSEVKGFDPYEILGVDPDAPIEKIKKSYRKLALRLHPDRNPGDPEANSKFIMISKAYECLTDEQAKENCLKFGNPEGSASFNVGIALPSFLVKKQNQVTIMAIVFLVVVIILPVFLLYYFGEVNKYDEYGMLQESHPYIHSTLNQNLSIRDCVRCMGLCIEFKNLRISRVQGQKLQTLFRQADEDIRKVFLKKKYFNYIKKSMILIDARITQKHIPSELVDDLKFIMKKMPTLVKAAVMEAASRSPEVVAKRNPQAFVGINAMVSLIVFGQFFLQGVHYEGESFEQLDFTESQKELILKKKKKKRITEILNLKRNQEDRDFMLQLLSPARAITIKEQLEYIPTLEFEDVIIHCSGEKDITVFDIYQVIVRVRTNRKSHFCSAPRYPFLKKEGWYILVEQNNHLMNIQHFAFDDLTYEMKFQNMASVMPGTYSLTVKVMSDCYIGLDIHKVVKYEVGKKKLQDLPEEQTTHHEEQPSLFSRMMSSMLPTKEEEEEELSDKDD